MLARLSRKINNQTQTHFKLQSKSEEQAKKMFERCKTEQNFYSQPISPNKKPPRDRRGSHRSDNFSGLNDSKISLSISDSKINQLKMMKRMATMDLKLIMEKKISEKKSIASNSTKTLQTIVNPFRLEDKPDIFAFNEEDEINMKVKSFKLRTRVIWLVRTLEFQGRIL